jgi:hypothetical protein
MVSAGDIKPLTACRVGYSTTVYQLKGTRFYLLGTLNRLLAAGLGI